MSFLGITGAQVLACAIIILVGIALWVIIDRRKAARTDTQTPWRFPWAALILVIIALMFYFRFCSPRPDDDVLKVRIDSLEVEILIRELQIDSADRQKVYFFDTLSTLRKEQKELKTGYDKLLMRKSTALAVEVPPNQLYTELQEEIYPDSSKYKPFSFTPYQVQSIYMTSLELSYTREEITLLDTRLAVSGKEIALQDSLRRLDGAIIVNYAEIVENLDEQLEISGTRISERDRKIRRRGITGAAIAVGAFIVGVLVGN